MRRSWSHSLEVPKQKDNHLGQVGAVKEVENEEKKEWFLMDNQEQDQDGVMEDVKEGEILVLRRVLS